MPTQIIDGFRLNAATPIDSRMVTTGQTSRNNLAYKYEGLRVYDLTDKKPYVYIDGAWVAESGSAGGGSGEGAAISGTTGRIVKYDNTYASGATNSAIYDASTSLTSPRIGIGTSAPASGMALHVIGNVQATSFKGNIGAENITSGQLALTRLTTGPASGSYVLKSLNGNVSWVAESATAGTIAVTNETTYTSQAYLVFAKSYGSGGAQLFANDASTSKRIAIKPDTSQILASADTANITRPGYSFVGADTAGLYGVSTEIGLVFSGKKQLSIKDGNHTLYNSSTIAVLTTVSTGVSIGSNNAAAFDLFLKAGTGALATPSISWAGDTSTGIWRSAAGKISVSATGVKVLEIGSQLLVPTGTEALPSLSFIGYTNSGLYRTSTELGLSFNGTKKIYTDGSTLTLSTTTTSISSTTTNVTGTLNVTGITTINNKLNTTALATLASLTVNGPTIISGSNTLNVGGTTTLSTTTTGSLTATGTFRANSISEFNNDVYIKNSSDLTVDRRVYVKDMLNTTYLFQIRDSTVSSAAPVYMGRYQSDQTATGDFWIRVDKSNTSSGVNWDGYWTFNPSGLFTTKKIKIKDVSKTIAFSVSSSSGVTYNHNLGYIPIAVVSCLDGNVNPNITSLTATSIRIYNYNSGGNAAVGTIYLW